MLSNQGLKRVHRRRCPRIDVLLLDVHVNVEHTPRRFEGQQARFPCRFTGREQPEVAPVRDAAKIREGRLVVTFVDGQTVKQPVRSSPGSKAVK